MEVHSHTVPHSISFVVEDGIDYLYCFSLLHYYYCCHLVDLVVVAVAIAGRGIAAVVEMALVATVAVALPSQDMALLAIAGTVGATFFNVLLVLVAPR